MLLKQTSQYTLLFVFWFSCNQEQFVTAIDCFMWFCTFQSYIYTIIFQRKYSKILFHMMYMIHRQGIEIFGGMIIYARQWGCRLGRKVKFKYDEATAETLVIPMTCLKWGQEEYWIQPCSWLWNIYTEEEHFL